MDNCDLEILRKKGIKKEGFPFRSVIMRNVTNTFGSLYTSEHKSMEEAIKFLQKNIETFDKPENIIHVELFKIKEDGEPWKK